MVEVWLRDETYNIEHQYLSGKAYLQGVAGRM